MISKITRILQGIDPPRIKDGKDVYFGSRSPSEKLRFWSKWMFVSFGASLFVNVALVTLSTMIVFGFEFFPPQASNFPSQDDRWTQQQTQFIRQQQFPVSSTDTKQWVKKYHALARKYHPDKNPNDPIAANKMRILNNIRDKLGFHRK